MSNGDPSSRRIPFPSVADSKEFMKQLAQAMRLRIDQLMGEMVPKENTEKFYHGRTFVYQQDDLTTHQGEFNKQSVEYEFKLESILAGDLQALPRFLETLVTTFVRQMKQHGTGIWPAFFLPDNYLDFGAEVIYQGVNHTFTIGHDVWTLGDLEVLFDKNCKSSIESNRSIRSAEVKALGIAASCLFPDRIPFFLECQEAPTAGA